MAEEIVNDSAATTVEAPEPPATAAAPPPDWMEPIRAIEERFGRVEQYLAQQANQQQAIAEQRRAAEADARQQAGDPEPDPYDDPRGHARWAARQEYRERNIESRLYDLQAQDFNRRVEQGREWLEDKGVADEYNRLVDLNDPSNPVRQYVDRNPGFLAELQGSANPIKRLYQLGKDLDVRNPQSFQHAVQQEVERQLQQRVQDEVAKALGKRQPSRISEFKPSVSNLPGGATGGSRAPREKSDSELRQDAYAGLKALIMGA